MCRDVETMLNNDDVTELPYEDKLHTEKKKKKKKMKRERPPDRVHLYVMGNNTHILVHKGC